MLKTRMGWLRVDAIRRAIVEAIGDTLDEATIPELQALALDRGLSEITTTSTEVAIGQILWDVAALPPDEMYSVLRTVNSGAQDRSLEEWADFMLGKV